MERRSRAGDAALRAHADLRLVRPADVARPALVLARSSASTYFAGGVVGVLRAARRRRARSCSGAGVLTRAITAEHYHDLGKLLFALHRLLGLHRLLPVHADLVREHPGGDRLVLLRRQTGRLGVGRPGCCCSATSCCRSSRCSRATPKRRPRLLSRRWRRGCWLMHWVDLYWLVMPELAPSAVPQPRPHDLLVSAAWCGVLYRCAAGRWCRSAIRGWRNRCVRKR